MGLGVAAPCGWEHSQEQRLCWTSRAQGGVIIVLDPDHLVGTYARQAQDLVHNEIKLSHLVKDEIPGFWGGGGEGGSLLCLFQLQ